MITKEYLQKEIATRINGIRPGVPTNTDVLIGEMKSILVMVDCLPDDVPLPEDTVLFNKGVAEGRRLESEENKDRDIVFWRGIQYAREMMMKEAEPAEIGYFNHRGLSILTEKSIERMPVSEGDKVRIIIIKDDGKSD